MVPLIQLTEELIKNLPMYIPMVTGEQDIVECTHGLN